MKLDKLIENVDFVDRINYKDVEVTGISYNSKTTQKGDIFVCLINRCLISDLLVGPIPEWIKGKDSNQ